MARLYIASQRHLARGDYRPLGIPRFKGVPPLKYPAQRLPPLDADEGACLPLDPAQPSAGWMRGLCRRPPEAQAGERKN
jgi:hypothetical protein